jgi:hypothetical protein
MRQMQAAPRRRWVQVPVPVVDFDAELHERLSKQHAGDAPAVVQVPVSLQERLTPRDAPADRQDFSDSSGKPLYERLPMRDAPAAKYAGMHEVVRRHERLLAEDAPAHGSSVHDVVRRHERLPSGDVPAKRFCVKHVRLSSGDVPAADAEGADAEGADCGQHERLSSRNAPAQDAGGSDRCERLSPRDVPIVYARTPRTERYMVRRPMVNDIIMRLNTRIPTVDGFGDAELHVWPRWWGPGSSECEDAFSVHWGSEPLLWLNPPFTLLDKVVEKLMADCGTAILVMPHWQNQWFYDAVKPFVVRKQFYKTGTMLFETVSGTSGGTPWPVWALLLDCRREGWQPVELELQKQRTKSSNRRWRQKWRAQPMC